MPEPSLVAAIARRELQKAETEHPAVMLERLLQEKHNFILENEKLRMTVERLREALQFYAEATPGMFDNGYRATVALELKE